MAKRKGATAQIYQFPLPFDSSESSFDVAAVRDLKVPATPPLVAADVVLSGTYRKDTEGLLRDYEELQDLGCRILSPTSARVVSEKDGFVFMKGESGQLPENIELQHLKAIQEAQFVWLHAPDGYVGLSAALEVGFAHAIGIPVYSRVVVADPLLATFVEHVASPRFAVDTSYQSGLHIPNPAVQAFQKYYKRAAVQRGYGKESARDTLLLMVEEVGELARAIRKKEKLTRHGHAIKQDEALELADVFIYVVHLANILGVDLSEVVKQKELLNIEKLLKHRISR